MSNILKRSLKVRVFVIFLAVAVTAVAILGGITYFSGRNIIRNEVINNLMAVSAKTETLVLNLLKRVKIETALIGDDHYLDSNFQKIVNKDQSSPQLTRELIEYLNDFQKNDSYIQEIVLLNNSGKILVSTDEKLMGVERADEEYFKDGKKGFHMRDAFQSKTTGKIGFVASQPMFSPDGKEQIGVIAIHYDVKSLSNITAEKIGMGETSDTFIVNKDALAITELKSDKDSVLKQKIDTKLVKLFQQEHKVLSDIYTDHLGDNVLGASRGLEIDKEFGLGWVIISRINTSEAFAPVGRLGITILIIGMILSTLIGFVAYFVASGIAAPVTKASRIVKMVGEGDLRQNVEEISSEDEIGILNNAIKTTIDYLRTMVSQTLSIAERVSASSQELSSSAQEMNATTEEVSSTVQQIAKGTETQAQRVDETQKVMEQMNASVAQVSKGAQDAALQALKSSEGAKKGGQSTEETRTKLIQISDAVIGSASDIKKLNERAEQVGEIVGVITNIADQTNLLALNAAIEAARAGEYGRGFAVVAEEVRKLAEGSAKASDEIRKIITDVQKETNQAASHIEGVAKDAESVRDITKSVIDSFAEIIKNTEGVASMVEQVSAASQEQAAGTKQISSSVAEIASVAEETASATEEASASTEEMTASMEEMAASAQELADMGMSLRDLVAKFKVGETSPIPVQPTYNVDKQKKESKLKEKALAMKQRLTQFRSKRPIVDIKH